MISPWRISVPPFDGGRLMTEWLYDHCHRVQRSRASHLVMMVRKKGNASSWLTWIGDRPSFGENGNGDRSSDG
jgi:hypothetical protein